MKQLHISLCAETLIDKIKNAPIFPLLTGNSETVFHSYNLHHIQAKYLVILVYFKILMAVKKYSIYEDRVQAEKELIHPT